MGEGKRERERERGREKMGERGVDVEFGKMCVCVRVCVHVLKKPSVCIKLEYKNSARES